MAGSQREMQIKLTMKVDQLKQATAEAEVRLSKLQQAAGKVGRGSTKMKKEVKAARIEISRLKSEAKLTALELKKVGGAVNTNNLRKNTRVMNQMAYALDDVQYGFRGVQNNLQQIAVLGGASGPVVLAITAIGIAVNYVVENFDKLFGKVEKAKDAVLDFNTSTEELLYQQHKLNIQLSKDNFKSIPSFGS